MLKTDIVSSRLVNQHLVGKPLDSPQEVVQHLGAVQAQDYAGAKWALAQRAKNLHDADIDKLLNDGTILRTHVLRPTWHFVLPTDIRWLLELTSPRVKQLMSYYNRKLELDDKLFAKSHHLIGEALKGGNFLTRQEISVVLGAGGIEAKGQRLGHIVMQAELDAVICSGPLRGKQFTYALLAKRAPQAKTLSKEESLAELAKRYFTGHGPAMVADFAWWSGLTMADARLGLEAVKPSLQSSEVNGKTYWYPRNSATPKTADTIHLLPNYDEYLISYKDYSPIFSDQVKKLDKPFGNAFLAHLLVRNGLVIGGWRRTIEKKQVIIKPDILVSLSRDDLKRLKSAAQDYERFIGMPVGLAN